MTDTRTPSAQGHDEALESARDSVTVAAWTVVSRATGLVRVAVAAAALGPTFLANTYQFTNSVPNLVYYGLLGGSLVSSLLVPTLARRIAAGDPHGTAAAARGFFGCAVAVAALAVPLLLMGVPVALRLTSGSGSATASAQVVAAAWLAALLAPQVACYAVIACSVAVMNAHRRFAIAAAGPTIENLGSIIVLLIVWLVWGSGREVTHVGAAEIAVLGLGTTASVGAHAAVQWYGARRAGVTLRPTRGWRDPQVRAVGRRSVLAVAQAGAWAVQLIVALALANRVPGGVVALLVATNFFFLPIAVGATPIALSVLPRLADHSSAGRTAEFDTAATRGLGLAAFVAAPAAVGYLLLATPLAHIVMVASAGGVEQRTLVASSLAALSIGIVGTAVFTVATYISYAREDARTPLLAMLLQTVVALAVMAVSPLVGQRHSPIVVAAALAAGCLVGAGVLLGRLGLPRAARARLWVSFARTAAAVAVMAPSVWLCEHALAPAWPGRPGQIVTVLVATLVGAGVYVTAHHVLRSPELALVRGSVSRRHRGAGLPQPVATP